MELCVSCHSVTSAHLYAHEIHFEFGYLTSKSNDCPEGLGRALKYHPGAF